MAHGNRRKLEKEMRKAKWERKSPPAIDLEAEVHALMATGASVIDVLRRVEELRREHSPGRE